MGFVRQRVYKLIWPEGAELEGLEVRASATSLRDYLLIQSVLDGTRLDTYVDEEDGETFDLSGDMYAGWQLMAKKFSQRLLEWNLTEKDGTAVPPTRDGVLSQDRELFLILVQAWLNALASVGRPLPKPSSDGTPLAGVSIPMETLSESQAS